ncbi:phosphatase PAP2 family protein [Variovorax paradoxus]|nr:phosphatase PAP2 family protein [Variovorax paradoxus]
MQALNIALFQALGAGHDPNAELLWFASNLAESASWLCIAIMGWVAWRRPSQRAYAVMTLAAAGVAAMLAHALADAIAMPRPFMMGLSPAHIEHGARGSLPSTHASVMFTVGLLFCLRASLRRVGLAIVAIAVLTGWARIYVGVHFPLDIVAGLLLASAIAALLWTLQQLGRRVIQPFAA